MNKNDVQTTAIYAVIGEHGGDVKVVSFSPSELALTSVIEYPDEQSAKRSVAGILALGTLEFVTIETLWDVVEWVGMIRSANTRPERPAQVEERPNFPTRQRRQCLRVDPGPVAHAERPPTGGKWSGVVSGCPTYRRPRCRRQEVALLFSPVYRQSVLGHMGQTARRRRPLSEACRVCRAWSGHRADPVPTSPRAPHLLEGAPARPLIAASGGGRSGTVSGMVRCKLASCPWTVHPAGTRYRTTRASGCTGTGSVGKAPLSGVRVRGDSFGARMPLSPGSACSACGYCSPSSAWSRAWRVGIRVPRTPMGVHRTRRSCRRRSCCGSWAW